MKLYLYYAAQVILISGILYGYYHFFLRNKRFHRYNRYFLLGTTILGLVIPLLNIPVYFSEGAKDRSVLLQTMYIFSSSRDPEEVRVLTGAGQGRSFFTPENLAWLVYALVLALLLTRTLTSIYQLLRMRNRNPSVKMDRILFIQTAEPGTPFSFFRWLFWNRGIELQSARGEQIFRHEYFHIQQRHSLDIVLFELVTAICWFNPFFHLAKKEVKAIHEFLADQFAVTEDTRWQYAELLLMRAMHTQQSLVNPFFHNQIKRRIAMITTSQQPGHQYLRKLMVLPLIFLAFLLFAFSYRHSSSVKKLNGLQGQYTDTLPGSLELKQFFYIKENEVTVQADQIQIRGDKKKIKEIQTSKLLIIVNDSRVSYSEFSSRTYFAREIELYLPNDPEAARKWGKEAVNGVMVLMNATSLAIPAREYYKNLSGQPSGKENTENKIFEKVEVEAAFPGGADKWRKYLEQNLDASVARKNKAPKGAYTVIVQFVVKKDGSISDVRTLTKHGFGMEAEALRVIKSGPRWLPALRNGVPVNAYRKQPVTFLVDGSSQQTAVPVKDALNEVILVSFENPFTPPVFPGGASAWKIFLEKNSKAMVPVDLGAPSGTYKAIVEFQVNTDGSLSDFKPVTRHGYGMEEEVIRLLQSGPKWKPAENDGKKMTARVQQPVTFVVSEEPGNSPPAPTNTRIPSISVAEIKMAKPYELLGLTRETIIDGFTFTTDTEKGDIRVSYNKGAEFNEATRNLIAGMTAGRLVTLDMITILENGQKKKAGSRVYNITN